MLFSQAILFAMYGHTKQTTLWQVCVSREWGTLQCLHLPYETLIFNKESNQVQGKPGVKKMQCAFESKNFETNIQMANPS